MGGERTDAYKPFPRVPPRYRTRNCLAAHAPSPDREPREWRQKHRAIVLISVIAAVPLYLAISTIYATDSWNALDVMAFDAKQSWTRAGNRLRRSLRKSTTHRRIDAWGSIWIGPTCCRESFWQKFVAVTLPLIHQWKLRRESFKC